MKKTTLLKTFMPAIMMLLAFTGLHAQTLQEVFKYDGSPLGTGNKFEERSGTYTDADNNITMNITASMGSINATYGYFSFGTNNGITTYKNSHLGNYPAIASALNIPTNKFAVAALIFEHNFSNIEKITYSHTLGLGTCQLALVYSINNGSSWLPVCLSECEGDSPVYWQDLSNDANASVTFEFTAIPIARYAVVLNNPEITEETTQRVTTYSQTPVVTFYAQTSPEPEAAFKYDGSPLGTGNKFEEKSAIYTDTDNNITMNITASMGSVNATYGFQFGTNNGVLTYKNSHLGNYPAIASALNIPTNKLAVAALIFEHNFSNIEKITYSHTLGLGTCQLALVYSINNGSSWLPVCLSECEGDSPVYWQDLSNDANASITFEFTAIPIARYAVVLNNPEITEETTQRVTTYSQTPVVTFYCGSAVGEPGVAIVAPSEAFEKEEITLSANSWNITEPIYTYSVKVPESEEFSALAADTYTPASPGIYTFKVEMTIEADPENVLASDEINVIVKELPQATVSLTISTPKITEGNNILMSISSQNVTSPVYTFWVKLPDASEFTKINETPASSTSISYTSTIPGIYTFKGDVAESGTPENVLATTEEKTATVDPVENCIVTFDISDVPAWTTPHIYYWPGDKFAVPESLGDGVYTYTFKGFTPTGIVIVNAPDWDGGDPNQTTDIKELTAGENCYKVNNTTSGKKTFTRISCGTNPGVTLTIPAKIFIGDAITLIANPSNIAEPVFTYSVKAPEDAEFTTLSSATYTVEELGTYTFKVEVAEAAEPGNMLAYEERQATVRQLPAPIKITVDASNTNWTDMAIYFWINENDDEKGFVTPEKEGNKYVYTFTRIENAVNIIFVNGSQWSSNKGDQSINIEGLTAGEYCYIINAETDVEGKHTVTSVSCSGSTLIEASTENIYLISSDQRIEMSFCGRADIQIYTIGGLLVKSESVENSFNYPMKKGAYIVRINDKVCKVLVK